MNIRVCSPIAATLFYVLLGACGSDEPAARQDVTAAPAPAASQPTAQPPAPAPPAREKVAYAGELPPLPVTNFPAARPPEIVRAVYEFAARRPDVLRYVPCFCGCERNGHVHNEHCFVSGRDANGKPRWDSHGFS